MLFVALHLKPEPCRPSGVTVLKLNFMFALVDLKLENWKAFSLKPWWMLRGGVERSRRSEDRGGFPDWHGIRVRLAAGFRAKGFRLKILD